MPTSAWQQLQRLSQDLQQHKQDLDSARYVVISLCKALDLSSSGVEKAMRLAASCSSTHDLQDLITHLTAPAGEEAEGEKEKGQNVGRQTLHVIAQLRDAIDGILELLVQKGVISTEEVREVASLQAFIPGAS